MNHQLTKNIHIRIDEKFEQYLIQIANSHHLKPSTFARMLLLRHVSDYNKNRFMN